MDRPRKPLHDSNAFIYPHDTSNEYIKLTVFILFLMGLSVALTWGRGWGIKYLFQDFVAALFISSSAYKMFRLEVFVKIFKSYDVFAQRWPFWAYLYPFVELGIGADYLLSNGSPFLYILALVFTGATIYQRFTDLKSRIHVQYACLDTVIRLPISAINLVVNTIGFVVTLLVVLFS